MRDTKRRGWLSTRQAAERLGVSEASVRRWSDSGLLPAHRVGVRAERRFKPEDVDRFDRSPKAAPPPRAQVVVGGLPIATSTHLAAFYDSDAGRLRLTGLFLAEGLRLGQPCFLVAFGDVMNRYLDWLRRSPGVDLEAARAAGQLQVVGVPGATVAEALAYWEQALWTAVEAGAPVIRVVGEMACERELFATEQEMLAYEAAFNLTTARFPCVVICQYDVRHFSGRAIHSALRAHPDLFTLPLGAFVN